MSEGVRLVYDNIVKLNIDDSLAPSLARSAVARRGWQAGVDEAGPAGARQHVNLDIEQMGESRRPFVCVGAATLLQRSCN